MVSSEGLAQRRRDRAHAADELLRQVFTDAIESHFDQDGHRGDEHGMALVAVGGYGRSELSLHSDLDVVLLHDRSIAAATVAQVANAIWYPLWDQGIVLDHAVRDTVQMRTAANDDYRAATGMLEARAIAGDTALVLDLRTRVLTDWRRNARKRLAEMRQARDARIARAGWIAHSAIPDLKESGGGLRDGALLRALVATWLVDVPHLETEDLRHRLLDVRDLLHEETDRRSDRLTPEVIPAIAERLDMSPPELDLHVRGLGRRTAHLSALVWRRIDELDMSSGRRIRTHRRTGAGPQLDSVARGVAVLGREVVLTADADPSGDPEVALRLAQEAASRDLVMSSGSVTRLAVDLGNLPQPWPRTANRELVNLLASGRALQPVWDELDYAGVIERWLPEWSAVRLRGSSSPIHRFTIDRHSIETCIEAKAHLRTVSRPDLLVVGALLHDIGKGLVGDHSEVGAPMAATIALRWGFSPPDANRIAHLVRWHLLLPMVAMRRDIEDPSTAASVAEIIGDLDALELLAALTESDARATGAAAWSPWRAGLVAGLVAKTRAVLQIGVTTPDPDDYEGSTVVSSRSVVGEQHHTRVDGADLLIDVVPHHAGALIRISGADRIGSMADMAGGIALAGLEVLSARAVTTGTMATTLWEVTREDVDLPKLAERIKSVVDGSLDLAARFGPSSSADAHPVSVRELGGLSQTATLIEVRARDRRGLVWSVCRAIAAHGVAIRSAHLSTYGPEARDVFYVVDATGDPLDDQQAGQLCVAVTAALSGWPAEG